MTERKEKKKKGSFEEKSNPLVGKYDDFYANAKVYDQKFGLVLTSDNLRQPAKLSLSYGPDDFYPWRPFAAPDSSTHRHNKAKQELIENNFAIHIDVQHFKPREIKIRVTGRQCSVKAAHGDREDDHGFVSRKFNREFTLPSDIVVESVSSVISSDGVLTFKAARTKPKKIKKTTGIVNFVHYPENEDYIPSDGIEIPIEFVGLDEQAEQESTSASVED